MLETDQAHDKQMELRQFIRTDITASAIAHLSVLALIFLFTEVHPFGVVTAEPIAVDIVTPDEVPGKEPAKEPDPVPPPPTQTPSPDASSQAKSEAANAPQSSKPQPAAPPPASARQQQQAAPSPPRSGKKEVAAAQPQPQAQPQSQPSLPAPSPSASPPPPPAASVPAYTPPQPDLTLKYHVMLGLPEDLPLPSKPASSGDKPGDGIDATASSTADITSSVVAEFRRHLKMCSRLPDSVAASDNVIIKLRVLMRPDGRLAREPILIEASASAKGPLLMQSAISALLACQPYAMLPAERYGEWKVLDLSFSPQDFNS
jgi:hypothetical protein